MSVPTWREHGCPIATSLHEQHHRVEALCGNTASRRWRWWPVSAVPGVEMLLRAGDITSPGSADPHYSDAPARQPARAAERCLLAARRQAQQTPARKYPTEAGAHSPSPAVTMRQTTDLGAAARRMRQWLAQTSADVQVCPRPATPSCFGCLCTVHLARRLVPSRDCHESRKPTVS